MRVFVWLTCLALLSACPGGTNETGKDTDSQPVDTDTTPELRDQDADGQYEDVDCNDADPEVYPGAPETCDHKDNDCDRNIDEGLTSSTWYADADADGYGATTSVEDCTQPDGYVADGGDCNDDDARYNPGATEEDCATAEDFNCDGSVGFVDADADGFAACHECDDHNPQVNPAAAEVCDGEDNNCDLVVDSDAVDAGTWYVDADGDGFGDDTTAVRVCDPPAGSVPVGGDCDDSNPDFNPSVVESDCSDPADYNCDGSTGYEDRDADGFAACDPSECDDTNPEVNAAGTELCDGVDNDCDVLVDESDAEDAPAWYADGDADGYGDAVRRVRSCEAPVGFVANDLDCDDADASYNPGAIEDCSVDIDYNCDGSTGFADEDLDGWAACDECEDTDARVNPDGVEVCNGTDDNCDGVVDTDASDRTVWYYDGDGDGFGDDSVTLVQCDEPVGFVSTGGDCDDADPSYLPGATESDCTDPADYNCDGSTGYADADEDGVAACLDCDDTDAEVFPGAAEICNAVDDDCDGAVDVDAIDPSTWYTDADGDGYGETAAVLSACTAPSGAVAVGGDCDDTDAAYNPGAPEDDCTDPADYNCDGSTGYTDADEDGYAACDPAECDDTDTAVNAGAEERCNEVDDNCDGVVDDDATTGLSTWYADADGDGYGDSTRTLAACELPAGYAAVTGDCDDASAFYNPAAEEADCTDPNDYNCDGSTGYADEDADGHAACEDCDDTDASIHPGATETCNLVDDNCNGSVDGSTAVDRGTWYTDADTDGFGDDASVVIACDQPAGTVAAAGDCDDAVAAVNPDADETCDEVDDDCDGDVDEAGAVDAPTWYADADGDGFGALAPSVVACEAPPGTAATNDDCDDSDDQIRPDAEETCSDGVDNNCDGTDDGCAWTGDHPLTDLDLQVDGAGEGDALGGALASGDLDADGIPDLAVGAAGWNDGGGTDSDGRVYLWLGPVSGEAVGTADASFSGSTDAELLGSAVATPGDVDGDGLADLLLGAPGAARHVAESGGAYLFAGPFAGALDTTSATSAIFADTAGLGLGSVLAGAGDEATDGAVDVALGAPDWEASTGVAAGAVALFDGPLGVELFFESDSTAFYSGEAAGDRAGAALLAGVDFDGDGLGDFLVGAPGNDAGGTDAGAVYLVVGPHSTEASLADAETILVGSDGGDAFGTSLASTEDLDDDGFRDFLAGAPGVETTGTDQGAVYVFAGGTPLTSTTTAAEAQARFLGAGSEDALGSAVAAAGDVDGDGEPELLLGALGVDEGTTTEVGAVYLLPGPFSGTRTVGADGARFVGTDSGDAAGAAVVGVGDTDSDGRADFAFGVPGRDDGLTPDAGAWLLGLGAGL